MILITGLTGTSGSAFYEVLIRENYEERIRVFLRSTSDTSLFSNSPLDLELCTGDLDDIESLHRAMDGCDTVFHIAAKGKIRNIATAVSLSPSVKNLILVSSTIIYSKYYTNSSLHSDEAFVRKILSSKNIRYVFIRPTMIFGTPGDQNISVFIRWFEKYSLFPIVKNGSANISPISRLDIAEAYWKILSNFNQLKCNEYIISGKEPMSLLEMFQIITTLQRKRIRFINIPMPIAKTAVNIVYYLSRRKIDYREKLDRLTEDRAFPHDIFANELGFDPPSFSVRVAPLIEEIRQQERIHSAK